MNRILIKLGFNALSKWPHPEITKLNLSITGKCNHRCLTCQIWKGNQTAKEMPLRVVEVIFERNHNLMWVSLTGGEPTLHPDFDKILEMCLQAVPLVNVISNGQLPDKTISSVLKALQNSPRSHLLVFHVSVLGSNSAHDNMTGVSSSYGRAVETLTKLKALNQSERLIIGAEHLISQYNPGEYKHVQTLANKIGIGVTFTLEQRAGYYVNKSTQLTKCAIPKVSFTFNPIDIVKNSFLLNTRRRAGCVAGEYSCWVTPDMSVYPCLFWIPNRASYNLFDRGYRLRREYFELDRERIRDCAGCWTPCESYTTIIYRPWRILRK